MGSNGALGEELVAKLSLCMEVDLFFVTRSKEEKNNNSIFWDYSSVPPKDLFSAEYIVNCARSKNFKENIMFNKLLHKYLPDSVKLINLSSNAIFARPVSKFESLIFRGDAYIREKKTIENIFQRKKNVFLLRPTVVLDEGSWRFFFEECKNAKGVFFPKMQKEYYVKIVLRRQVVSLIVDLILKKDSKIPIEIFSKKENISNLFGNNVIITQDSNTYYKDRFKNYATILLTSVFMPDFLAFSLQHKFLEKNKKIRTSKSRKNIEGMTRLYLFGGHNNSIDYD